MTILLKHIAHVSTNMVDADFWIQRRGSIETVGTIKRKGDDFNKEDIGVKFAEQTIIQPRYYAYVLEVAHSRGLFKQLANGTTQLVNIKVEDVRNFQI